MNEASRAPRRHLELVRFRRFMCCLTMLGLLLGVALIVWSHVAGPSLAYDTLPALFVSGVLLVIIASWGHDRSRQHGGTTSLSWDDLVATAPRWSLALLAITGAHLVIMGGWALLRIGTRTPTRDLDPQVVLAMQNLAVLIHAWAVVTAWSALRSHWSQIDLDDFDLD